MNAQTNVRETTSVIPFRTAPKKPAPSVDAQIRAFLEGETHGEELLRKLYDDILDEPIPERMRALLKK